MITLFNLVQQGLIEAGNTIVFLYKGNKFEGLINELGIIFQSFVSTDTSRMEIFKNRLPFESLSDWSDSCIQDICHEYVTRFSAWKRLKHKESGLSMQSLRHMYTQFFIQRLPLTNISINTLRQYVSVFMKHADKLQKEIHAWESYADGYTTVPPKKTIAPPHFKLIKFNYSKFLSDKHITEIALDERQV
tara:strand:- start:57231 stop:57800 length:570 start_codon:yes stop_codon:yes gene_type:complete